jgi:hypothetical protein
MEPAKEKKKRRLRPQKTFSNLPGWKEHKKINMHVYAIFRIALLI